MDTENATEALETNLPIELGACGEDRCTCRLRAQRIRGRLVKVSCRTHITRDTLVLKELKKRTNAHDPWGKNIELGVLGTGTRNWWSRSQNFEEEKNPMNPQIFF